MAAGTAIAGDGEGGAIPVVALNRELTIDQRGVGVNDNGRAALDVGDGDGGIDGDGIKVANEGRIVNSGDVGSEGCGNGPLAGDGVSGGDVGGSGEVDGGIGGPYRKGTGSAVEIKDVWQKAELGCGGQEDGSCIGGSGAATANGEPVGA